MVETETKSDVVTQASSTTVKNATTSKIRVDLTGVTIDGVIPEKIFQVAYDYLVIKLGADYVKENIVVTPKQREKSYVFLGYELTFIDKRYTSLLDIPNKQIKYTVYVDRDGSLAPEQERWSNVPDCASMPSLCEIIVTKKDALDIIAKVNQSSKLYNATPTLGWHKGNSVWGACLADDREISFKKGWFWEFFGKTSKNGVFEINVSTAATNTCKIIPHGDG